jgi:dyslexia susceptibility 1 candidate gene 1 protein
VSAALRGLKIIRSFKNRVIAWGDGLKLSKEERQKLKDFEVRFLIRRSNAYLQQAQVFNAKNDLEEALKLDPDNVQLK